jgi:hypothetical protein
LAELIATGATETPIDTFSLARFSGELAFNDKLWHEFDPELVARFRKRPAADDAAGGRSAEKTA